jgi:hypothetical protein
MRLDSMDRGKPERKFLNTVFNYGKNKRPVGFMGSWKDNSGTGILQAGYKA